MILNEQADELARLCSADLGQEITRGDVHRMLLFGFYPERLCAEEKSDVQCTLIKELDRMTAKRS